MWLRESGGVRVDASVMQEMYQRLQVGAFVQVK
jgi:hypothetical protein